MKCGSIHTEDQSLGDRYIEFYNFDSEIFVIDLDPFYGGLYLWIMDDFGEEGYEDFDIDHNDRLKIIGVDMV